MNRSVLFAGLAAVLLLAARVPAAEIQNVNVTAVSSQYASLATSTPELCPATNVVGNTGLYGDIHTYLRGGAMWLTASNMVNASGANAFITFDLGAVHTLDFMKVWNYNGLASSSPSSALATNLGVRLANISYSTDGLAFTTNLTGQVFNPAPGKFTTFAQDISLGGISARYIRIDIITNWAVANSQVGLSKVRFVDDSVVPTVAAATENYSSNQVTITFSESVDPQSATNPANYAVQSGAVTAGILNAALGQFANQVILHTTPLTNQNYSLTAAGVYDEALTAAIANTNLAIQSELVLWLRADAGTVVDENGNVTNWLDQSGYGHNALTTTVNQYSAPPTLASGALNNLPVVNFSGSQLLAVSNDSNLAINGDMTLCLVLERTASGTEDPISKTGGQGIPYTGTPLHGYTNNLPAPFDLQLASSTGKPVLVWGNQGGGAPTTLTSAGGLSVGQYYIVTLSVKGATNISSYLNGNLNGATILSYAAADAGNPLMLGVRSDSGNASDGGAQFTGNLAEAMLIRGTITPGDLAVMNTYLGAKYNIPVTELAITEEPQNTMAQIGKTATFWVGATGVPPLTYQWKTNNVNITKATNAVYITPALTVAANGLAYSVTVTSPVGSTNSTAANLTVVNDTNPPTVFSAVKTAGLTNVIVTFSEAVAGVTALNPANYALNNGAAIVAAAYGSAVSNSVVLTVSTLNTNAGYYLAVQNIQDLSGNVMNGVTVPVLPAGLSLYLRGDSGVGLDDNGLVDQWLDQTTNGNNAVQYLGGPVARPIVSSTINGVPALNFNGNSSNYLQAASSPSLALMGDMSVYAVANISDYTAPREILGKTSGAQPASYDYYAQNASTLRFYRGNGSASGLAVATQAPSAGVPHVLSAIMAGTNASQYLDGGANGSTALSTTLGDGGAPLDIGSRNDLSQFMNGSMAEVMVFNDALSAADRTNVDNYLAVKYFPFAITQQPQNVTTNEGCAVTFSVAASQGSAHFVYQWQENSTNIPGATGAAYTTPPLAPGDNGDVFAVLIMVPGLSTNVSATATVTVNNVPPAILSAGVPIWSQTNIIVIFSEAVDPVTATTAANYSLNNGATVVAAVLGDVPGKVVLTTSTLTSGSVYTLNVQNVEDLYGNTIVSASPAVGIYPTATALWLKAGSSVTTDANGVNQWNDLSGNGNNLTQSYGPPYEPQLVTNAINGLPVIRFAATNQTYLIANSSPSLAITGDMAVFAVINFATLAGNTNGMIVSKAAGNLPAPYDYYVRPGQAQFYRGNGTAYGLANSTGVPAVGVPQLLDVVMQGTTVTQRLNGRTNGVGVISTTIGDTGQPLSIGMRDDAGDFLSGDMAELVVIGSSVSSNDLVSLENYLGGKYNFPISTQSFPVITREPVAVTNVNQDAMLVIPAAGAGNPAVSFQWYDTNNVALSGQTNATLVISNILVSDSYYLTVSNVFGATNSTVVEVNVAAGAPQVSLAPASLELYTGLAHTYVVAAAGTAPFAYQWYQNDAFIPGATNASFSLTVLPGANTYSCTASNGFSAVSSGNVTLTGVTPPTAEYPAFVLSNNPVAYWRLGEVPDNGSGNQGTLAHDYVGGHNAAYANVVLDVSGYNSLVDTDTAALFGTFAASNSCASEINQSGGGIANVDFATPAGGNAEFSVEAWVNSTNASQVNGAGIVSKGYGNGGEQFDLDLYNNAFRFFVRDASGGVHGPSSTFVPTVGLWYHVVAIWDGVNGAAHLYVDGADVMDTTGVVPGSGLLTATTTNAVLPGAALVNIGARASSQATTNFDFQFQGRIDDVAIYNYALSPGQVAAAYQAGTNAVSINTNPTNIIVAVSGNQLTLSWPADHTGWTLQAQTNSLGAGLGTNWVTVTGSTSVNSLILPVNPANGSVFYRLIYP